MPTSVTNFFRGVVSKKKKRLVDEEDGGGGGGGTSPRRGSKAIGAEPALEDIYEARDDEADDDDEAHDGDAQPTRCDREGYPIDG